MSPKHKLNTLEQILDLARWAPSGDNTQVWRFELIDAAHLVIHGFDTRDHCVYDFQGHFSQISIGALLENIVLAASCHGLAVSIKRRDNGVDRLPKFDVHFTTAPKISVSPLISAIKIRCVQRKPLSIKPLKPEEKVMLEKSIGSNYRIIWLEGFSKKMQAAKLMFSAAKIRLTMPEAYLVHRDVIDWHTQFSESKIPDRALGINPISLRLMQWAMQSWKRMKFLNTYFGAHVIPRLEMDFMPSIACAAHFVIVACTEPESIDDFIDAGRTMQRFWLTATQLKLQLQPEITPLVFESYVRSNCQFSRTPGLWDQAMKVSEQLEKLLGVDIPSSTIFIGRIGKGKHPIARSTRLPLDRLCINSNQIISPN